MTTTKGVFAAGAGAFATSLLLAGPAAAQPELEPAETVDSLTQALTDNGYADVSCEQQELANNQVEFTVPEEPGDGREWAFVQAVAPYDGDTGWHEVLPVDAGVTLSVLNVELDRLQVPITDLILCSVAIGAGGGNEPFEGGALNATGIYLAFDGETRVDPAPPDDGHGNGAGEGENPVVETDVPATSPRSPAVLIGLGALAGAGLLTVTRRRGLFR